MCVKYEYIRSKIADNSGSIWSVNRNKYQLILVMWVTVSQHMCHKFFHKCRLCPLSWGLKDALPRSAAISPVGHWHVSLVCVRCCSKMSGRERTLRSMPHYCHIIVVELDTAPRRTLLWSAVSWSQYSRTFRTTASRGMLLITSATSLGRRYTRGVDLYAGLEFWTFFWPSRRRVDLYAYRLVHAYMRYVLLAWKEFCWEYNVEKVMCVWLCVWFHEQY